MNITDRTTARTIRTSAMTLGIKLPKPVADAYARADQLEQKVRHLGVDDTLESAVMAALLADREPATDPDVQRIVTAQALDARQTLPDSIAAAAQQQIAEACAANLDAITTLLSKAFDAAVREMTTAHARIGDLPLEDTTTIMAKGRDIADVWASASMAVGTIDTALTAWTALMQFTRSAQINPDHRPLRLAALTHDQWLSLPAKLRPWDALRAGLRLSLPTAVEYRQRIAAMQREAAHIAAEVPVDREREGVKAWAKTVQSARREAVSS